MLYLVSCDNVNQQSVVYCNASATTTTTTISYHHRDTSRMGWCSTRNHTVPDEDLRKGNKKMSTCSGCRAEQAIKRAANRNTNSETKFQSLKSRNDFFESLGDQLNFPVDIESDDGPSPFSVDEEFRFNPRPNEALKHAADAIAHEIWHLTFHRWT